MNSINWVELPHSSRRVLPSSVEVGPVNSEEIIEATVYVRRNPKAAGALPPIDSNNETVTATFSAGPEDIAKVETFARAYRLEVRATSIVNRSIVLRGTVAALTDAFKVNLKLYEYPLGRFRGRIGSVSVPADLDGIVEAVFGLDNRKVGRSYLRRPINAAPSAFTRPAGDVYFPPQVAQLYNYPVSVDGKGECIGILAFNNIHHGGYSLDAVRAYFNQLQIPTPAITDVVVSGIGNDPGDDGPLGDQSGDTSSEIMLDVQIIGSVAPGARIVVYFTEFTERGWVDAIYAAVTDTANNPSVISVSYGNPEDAAGTGWTMAAILKLNEAFGMAAAKGITVCCASGDQGASDLDAPSRQLHVDFPASSPFVLGCGGTRLESFGGVVVRETVWNDGLDQRGGLLAGGGGVSEVFPLPTYQNNAGVPSSLGSSYRTGRGVPDVSGVADPETPVVVIRLNGRSFARVGGTSVAAPLWAALIARINQALGRCVGFLNPTLYGRFSMGVLRDITQGTNGWWRALPGWDACTGLGSPDGTHLLHALSAAPAPATTRGLGEYRGFPSSSRFTAAGNFVCYSCGRDLPATERSLYWWRYAPYWCSVCSTCFATWLGGLIW